MTGTSPVPPRLEILAGFVLRRGSSAVRLSPSAQRLAAYLALQDRPVRRCQVADVLWRDAVAGAASLRTTLWRAGAACGDLIDAGPTHLCLSAAVEVDIREGMVLTRAITDSDGTFPTDNVRAVLRLSADLLPDWYEEWLVQPRENWRQRRLHALDVLALRLAARGRHALAVEAALAAIAEDPLRESAHRSLIHAHLLEGNRAEAVSAYHRLRDLLDRDLGVTPSADVQRLVADLPLARQAKHASAR